MDYVGEHEGHLLNCLPSPYSAKDYKVFQLFASAGITLDSDPQPIDYRPYLPPVFDQGQRGSCVACAIDWTVKAYQEIVQNDYPADGLSASFLYTICKQIDGITGEGTTPKAAMQVLQKYGICPESLMPYSTLSNLPEGQVPSVPDKAIQGATPFKIASYAQVCAQTDPDRSQLLDAMRLALKKGPFMIALLVCDNFKPDSNYNIPLPNGSVRGGHALGVVGDQPGTNRLIIRNTWGSDWGENGYAYLPYEWLTHGIDMSGNGDKMWTLFEAWTATDIVVAPTQPTVVQDGYMWIGKNYALIDGVQAPLDVAPIIVGSRTLAPMRFVFERAGYTVDWNADKQEIHFTKGVLLCQKNISSFIIRLLGMIKPSGIMMRLRRGISR